LAAIILDIDPVNYLIEYLDSEIKSIEIFRKVLEDDIYDEIILKKRVFEMRI
jgi:hypothetical protein